MKLFSLSITQQKVFVKNMQVWIMVTIKKIKKAIVSAKNNENNIKDFQKKKTMLKESNKINLLINKPNS